MGWGGVGRGGEGGNICGSRPDPLPLFFTGCGCSLMFGVRSTSSSKSNAGIYPFFYLALLSHTRILPSPRDREGRLMQMEGGPCAAMHETRAGDAPPGPEHKGGRKVAMVSGNTRAFLSLWALDAPRGGQTRPAERGPVPKGTAPANGVRQTEQMHGLRPARVPQQKNARRCGKALPST